jgi:predicted ATPase
MPVDNPIGRAKTLLADDFFKDVVNKQRQMYISIVLNSHEDAVDIRERALQKLRGLDEFIASLESISATQEIKEKRFKIF